MRDRQASIIPYSLIVFSLINFMKKISLKNGFILSTILPTCEVVALLQVVPVKPRQSPPLGLHLAMHSHGTILQFICVLYAIPNP